MTIRNSRWGIVVMTAVLFASCGGADDALPPTPTAAESSPTTSSEDSTTTSSPPSEVEVTDSSVAVTTTTSPADDGRPSCLQSDIVTEEGYSVEDWPDEFCDYWPSIHDTFEPLPSNWSAPEGWVELDALATSFARPPSPDFVLPPEGVDPRLRAFTFRKHSGEGDYSGRFVSEEMPVGGSISDLPDGVYTASLSGWDRSIPDGAVFRLTPIMDCVPGGIWGEYDVWGEPLCWGEPGERHAASPTCGPMKDLCVEVEVALDDSFTVMSNGYSKLLNEQGFPDKVDWIAQGPAFVELLTTLHDDYYDTFIANSALGPERIESEIVPNSPFISVIQSVANENEDMYNFAAFYNSQVFAWSRPEFPLITMYAHGNWGDEWTSPSLFPITPWGLEHFYDESGQDTCSWWELNYTRAVLADANNRRDIPCRIEEGIFSFEDQLPRNGGSFMKMNGRTAWVMDLPYANS